MCGCNNIVKTSVRFSDGLKNPDHDLVGMNILTTKAKSGKVIENVTNNGGDVIGYIISDSKGKKSSIFRNEVLQKNK